MARYKISIEYDGTDYSGWQRQPNARTVEEEIENALSQILRQEVDVKGQGRTDSGVHAEGQVAHFDYDGELDQEQLLYALLGVLPRNIAVYDMEKVASDFHARFHALRRCYRYQIVTRPSPLWQRQSLMVLNKLNIEVMQKCAEMIRGTQNFESFTKSRPDQERTECIITVSEFRYKPPMLTYRIEGNRFLRHMVRRLVGSMLQVGKGKVDITYFEELISNPRKDIGGHGAPSKGLILVNVEY